MCTLSVRRDGLWDDGAAARKCVCMMCRTYTRMTFQSLVMEHQGATLYFGRKWSHPHTPGEEQMYMKCKLNFAEPFFKCGIHRALALMYGSRVARVLFVSLLDFGLDLIEDRGLLSTFLEITPN